MSEEASASDWRLIPQPRQTEDLPLSSSISPSLCHLLSSLLSSISLSSCFGPPSHQSLQRQTASLRFCLKGVRLWIYDHEPRTCDENSTPFSSQVLINMNTCDLATEKMCRSNMNSPSSSPCWSRPPKNIILLLKSLAESPRPESFGPFSL